MAYQELWEELSAIHYVMNISRAWAGNPIALRALDMRETEITRALSSFRQS